MRYLLGLWPAVQRAGPPRATTLFCAGQAGPSPILHGPSRAGPSPILNGPSRAGPKSAVTAGHGPAWPVPVPIPHSENNFLLSPQALLLLSTQALSLTSLGFGSSLGSAPLVHLAERSLTLPLTLTLPLSLSDTGFGFICQYHNAHDGSEGQGAPTASTTNRSRSSSHHGLTETPSNAPAAYSPTKVPPLLPPTIPLLL